MVRRRPYRRADVEPQLRCMRMSPEGTSIVGIEGDELLLEPDNQLLVTIDVDDDGRAGGQGKRIAPPGQSSSVAFECDNSFSASTKGQDHVTLVGKRARRKCVIALQLEESDEVVRPAHRSRLQIESMKFAGHANREDDAVRNERG